MLAGLLYVKRGTDGYAPLWYGSTLSWAGTGGYDGSLYRSTNTRLSREL